MRTTCAAILLTLIAATLGGCTSAQWSALRGEQTKRDIYLNLMTDEQSAQFREMEEDWRDDEQMVLWCQEIGVYQKWRAAPPERQALIRKRQVEVGMTGDEVRMAWGRPAKVEDTTEAAERAEKHAREVWGYDPTGGGDAVTYQRQATFFDGQLQSFRDFRNESLWKKMKFWEK
jgi:hypothetical protein